MSKIYKLSAFIICTFILLAIIGFFLLVSLVNPNHFREPLNKQLSHLTGRTTTIKGDISWTLFPWLGLQLHQLQMDNLPSFGTQPFAVIQETNFKIKMLPLFIGKFEMGDVSINGMDILLIRNAQGKTNWETSSPSSKKSMIEAATASTEQPLLLTPGSEKINAKSLMGFTALNISSISVTNGHIAFLDQQQNRRIDINKLKANSSGISFKNEFPFSSEFTLKSNQPDVTEQISISGKTTLDPLHQHYQLRHFQINNTYIGSQYPGNKLQASFAGNADINMIDNKIAFTNIETSLANLKISGDLLGSYVNDSPVLKGTFTIPTFNLKKFLSATGNRVAFADPTALTSVAATLQLNIAGNDIVANSIKINIDDSQLTGKCSFKKSEQPSIDVDLNVTHLDVDRYLSGLKITNTTPSKTTQGSLLAGIGLATGNINAPANSDATSHSTNKLIIRGHIQSDALTLANIHFNKLDTQIDSENNILHINPIKAQLYQGTFFGNITLNFQRDVPLYNVNLSLVGVQAEPLFKDLAGITRVQVTGTADINSKLTMQGENKNSIVRSLNGSGLFVIKKGVLKGINLPYYLNITNSLIHKQTPATLKGNNETEFDKLTGTISFNHGIASNNDLQLQGPTLKATGHGTADLVNEQLNYYLSVIPTVAGLVSTDLAGIAIPIIITGPFNHLSIRPDTEAILKLILQNQLIKQSSKLTKVLGSDVGNQIQKVIDFKSLLH